MNVPVHKTLNRLLLPIAIGILISPLSMNSFAERSYTTGFSGEIRVESRWFHDSGAYDGQARNTGGIVFEPSFYIENERGWSFNITSFLRTDRADKNRDHTDLREAYFLLYGDIGDEEWELRLGVNEVFWGVSESANIVDIINQWDMVEDSFGKVKLGQLMAHFTLSGDWGAAELFYMPKHRLRVFPGKGGRLRGPHTVNNRLVEYESDGGDSHGDFALRYTLTAGIIDLGISFFDGNAREPLLCRKFKQAINGKIKSCKAPQDPEPTDRSDHVLELYPRYEKIRQYGLDISVPHGGFLYKFEAIKRTNSSNLFYNKDDYTAYVIGGEYTFYSLFGSSADLTIFGEFIHDARGALATSAFQDEIFLAGRVALNDFSGTEATLAILQDLNYASKSLSYEYQRRLTDDWLLKIEGLYLLKVDPNELVQYPTRRDSYINLSITYGF